MIVSPQSNKLNIIAYLKRIRVGLCSVMYTTPTLIRLSTPFYLISFPALGVGGAYVAFVHYANGFVAYLNHLSKSFYLIFFPLQGVRGVYPCGALDSRLRGNDERVWAGPIRGNDERVSRTRYGRWECVCPCGALDSRLRGNDEGGSGARYAGMTKGVVGPDTRE